MSSGEFLTRSTIWLAIAGYAIGTVVFATARRRVDANRWARLAWTIGCAALLAHFASAYEFYHAWSHASAYADTARQTAEVFKVNWGGGLFINYAVATLWFADVTWWWFAGLDSYRRRPLLLTLRAPGQRPTTSAPNTPPLSSMNSRVQARYAPNKPRVRYIHRSPKATVANTPRLTRPNPIAPVTIDL